MACLGLRGRLNGDETHKGEGNLIPKLEQAKMLTLNVGDMDTYRTELFCIFQKIYAVS